MSETTTDKTTLTCPLCGERMTYYPAVDVVRGWWFHRSAGCPLDRYNLHTIDLSMARATKAYVEQQWHVRVQTAEAERDAAVAALGRLAAD